MLGFVINAQLPPLLDDESTKYWIEVGSLIPVGIYTLYVTYKLAQMPETQKPISFKVPFLPYFPVMNLVVNTYLMANLDVAIWYKLLVWLGVGFFIYLTYGVSNSKENPKNKYSDEEKANLKLNEK